MAKGGIFKKENVISGFNDSVKSIQIKVFGVNLYIHEYLREFFLIIQSMSSASSWSTVVSEENILM